MNSIADLISGHRFFDGCDPATVDLLAGCGRNVVIPAGAALVRTGEPADVFWLLRRGRVAVGIPHPQMGMTTLETLGEGDVLGWSWLFPPYRWHFDAEARDQVGAVVFDAACLRRRCEADPRLGYELTQRFARVLDDRLHAASLRLADVYGRPSAR